MKLVLVLSLFSFIALLVVTLSELVSTVSTDSAPKLSPFECGFDSHQFSRKPFSVHFFFTCIVFLVFDVELLLLLPLITKSQIGQSLAPSAAVGLLVLVVFILGLGYEWGAKGLEWYSWAALSGLENLVQAQPAALHEILGASLPAGVSFCPGNVGQVQACE